MEMLGHCDQSLDQQILPIVLPNLLLGKGDNLDALQKFVSSELAKRTAYLSLLTKKFGSKRGSPSKSGRKSTSNNADVPMAEVNAEIVDLIAEGIKKLKETDAENVIDNLIKCQDIVTSSTKYRYFILLLLRQLGEKASTDKERYQFSVQHFRALQQACQSDDSTGKPGATGEGKLMSYEEVVQAIYTSLRTDDTAVVSEIGTSLLADYISALKLTQNIKKSMTSSKVLLNSC